MTFLPRWQELDIHGRRRRNKARQKNCDAQAIPRDV